MSVLRRSSSFFFDRSSKNLDNLSAIILPVRALIAPNKMSLLKALTLFVTSFNASSDSSSSAWKRRQASKSPESNQEHNDCQKHRLSYPQFLHFTLVVVNLPINFSFPFLNLVNYNVKLVLCAQLQLSCSMRPSFLSIFSKSISWVLSSCRACAGGITEFYILNGIRLMNQQNTNILRYIRIYLKLR